MIYWAQYFQHFVLASKRLLKYVNGYIQIPGKKMSSCQRAFSWHPVKTSRAPGCHLAQKACATVHEVLEFAKKVRI
jgi:hypothetical protein